MPRSKSKSARSDLDDHCSYNRWRSGQSEENCKTWQAPELKNSYLGAGVRPVTPCQLPRLLGKYFVDNGESRPNFTITHHKSAKFWSVKCKFKINFVDSECIAKANLRKVGRWVCSAKVLKHLGITNEDLTTINDGKKVEPVLKPLKLDEDKHGNIMFEPTLHYNTKSRIAVSHIQQVESDTEGVRYFTESASLLSTTPLPSPPTPLPLRLTLCPGTVKSDTFPTTYKQVVAFCQNLQIKSPNSLIFVLREVLVYKGHIAPGWSTTQYTDCEDSQDRSSGRWTVTCHAAGLSYSADCGGADVRTLAKQICAAGILITMGVTQIDIQSQKKRRAEENLAKKRLDKEARGISSWLFGSAIKSKSIKANNLPNPFGSCVSEGEALARSTLEKTLSKSAVDQFIQDARLPTISKEKRKLKRSLPADWEEIRRTISVPQLSFNQCTVKSEPLDEIVEPFQLVKAEPFPVVKVEPLPFVKDEPFLKLVKAEPLPFIKAEPFTFVKVEPDIPREERSEEEKLKAYDSMKLWNSCFS